MGGGILRATGGVPSPHGEQVEIEYSDRNETPGGGNMSENVRISRSQERTISR